MEDRFVGRVLEDRYEVRRPLARGGMGQVYVGHDRKLAVDVAVKFLVLRDGSPPTAELQQRFEGEAKILAKMRNPHILRPLSWGRTPDGELFMVTELLEGRPLDAVLREEGMLDPVRALRVLIDVCRALSEAHAAGVLHRDLKPANLFLSRSRSGEESTVVLDFGVAKVIGDPQTAGPETTPGVVLGTVAYMSPEQARAKPTMSQSDLYALGVVMFECLTGAVPFSGETVSVMLAHVTESPPSFGSLALVREVDPELEAIVRWLLEKDPSARPESAAKVIARAERLLAKLAPAPRLSLAPRRAEGEPEPTKGALPMWLGVIGATAAAVWLGLDLLTAPPRPPPAPSAPLVATATVAASPPTVAASAPSSSPSRPPPPGPPLATPLAPKLAERPRSARIEVARRQNLAETPGNDRAIARAVELARPCARGPHDIVISVPEDGPPRTFVKDAKAVEACVAAAIAELRFEAAGPGAFVQLKVTP